MERIHIREINGRKLKLQVMMKMKRKIEKQTKIKEGHWMGITRKCKKNENLKTNI